MDRQGLIK